MLQPSVDFWEYEDRHRCQEIFEGVFLGPSTITRDSDFLTTHKISNIVISRSVKEENFLKPRKHDFPINYHVIEIDDSPIASCMTSFEKFSSLVNHLSPEARILVIGMTGINRSAALVGILGMEKFGLSVDSIIEYLISRRRCVSISQNVKRQMMEFSVTKTSYKIHTEPSGEELVKTSSRKRRPDDVLVIQS